MGKAFLSALGAVAGLSALALPTSASAQQAQINFTSANPVPGNNDFITDLAGLGLTQYTTSGASIVLNGDALLTFDFLASESGFDDNFWTSTLSYTEMTAVINDFATPYNIGSESFNLGSLAGLLNFASLGGAPATVGDDGFGIFLGPNAASGDLYSVFYLGYDDQINNVDDNHDDMIIRVTVSNAVPEPATWALMLLGFAGMGMVVRKRRRNSGALMQVA